MNVLRIFVSLAAALSGSPAFGSQDTAARLTVSVSMAPTAAKDGEIGCALFPAAPGFPLDSSKVRTIWQPAAPKITCAFDQLAAGAYAIAVSHDVNGNKVTDRNFIGIPKEAWGVSNNVRPRMRAPRFDEAAVRVDAGAVVAIDVVVK